MKAEKGGWRLLLRKRTFRKHLPSINVTAFFLIANFLTIMKCNLLIFEEGSIEGLALIHLSCIMEKIMVIKQRETVPFSSSDFALVFIILKQATSYHLSLFSNKSNIRLSQKCDSIENFKRLLLLTISFWLI